MSVITYITFWSTDLFLLIFSYNFVNKCSIKHYLRVELEKLIRTQTSWRSLPKVKSFAKHHLTVSYHVNIQQSPLAPTSQANETAPGIVGIQMNPNERVWLEVKFSMPKVWVRTKKLLESNFSKFLINELNSIKASFPMVMCPSPSNYESGGSVPPCGMYNFCFDISPGLKI